MIDDAMLSEWEKVVEHPSLTLNQERLKQAIVEIRRLQKLDTPELLDENQALMEENWRLREALKRSTDDFVKPTVDRLLANLAAYQVVVRELAVALEAFVAGQFMDYGHAADTLTHPLVVAARKEERG